MDIEDVKEPEGSGPSVSEEPKPEEKPMVMGSDEPLHTESQGSEVKKPKRKLPWHFWVLLVILILGVGYIVYAQYGSQIADKLFGPVPVSTDTSVTAKPVTNNSTATTTTPATTKVTDEGVTWKTPVKLGDLGLFTANASYDGPGGMSGATYYSVGSTSTGSEIIVAEVQVFSVEIHRFLKKDGKYIRLAKNSHELTTGGEYTLNSAVTEDSSFYFKSLLPDKTMTKGETDLTYQFDGAIATDDGYDAGTKVDDTNWGDLKLEKGPSAPDANGAVKIARYYILMSDSTRAYYSVKPTFIRDDGTMNATFADSSKNTIAFDQLKTSGCGNGVGSFPIVGSASFTAGEVQVASTPGSKIYSFTDGSNALVSFSYKFYQTGQDSPKPLAQYLSDLGLVVWTDAYGSTITYSNRLYAPEAECGKPVIYLYPTKDTQVSVKVGADVTKSDPEYGNGWTALATPSGMLKVAGKSYDSLFWEGIGKGQYPTIKSGSVVPAAQAVARIKSDLSTVGLNGKEISDFLAFWQPKLPTTGSVRLSWFFNDDMNKLAPLAVMPKPDSVIRAFLDFSSVDSGTVIAPQTLPTYARNGFTLVEWGGLLRK
jgi:hypothetical protein